MAKKDPHEQRVYILAAIGRIREFATFDTGQAEAPSKQDYKNACLHIYQECKDVIDYLIA